MILSERKNRHLSVGRSGEIECDHAQGQATHNDGRNNNVIMAEMRVTPFLAFQPRTNMTDAVSEATGQAYAVTERVI